MQRIRSGIELTVRETARAVEAPIQVQKHRYRWMQEVGNCRWRPPSGSSQQACQTGQKVEDRLRTNELDTNDVGELVVLASCSLASVERALALSREAPHSLSRRPCVFLLYPSSPPPYYPSA